MSEELLPYYNRELEFFRKMSRGFAEQNPKIAARLKLGGDSSQDPHVERLIEAFAFLNARTRHKIDDDFPEISDAFLNTIYPHYLAPIPSMSVIQVNPDEGQADLYELPVGTEIQTEPVDGEPCRFRTTYPVSLWPLEIRKASLVRQPVAAPMTSKSGSSVAILRWELRTINEAVFSEIAPPRLRIYLDGPSQFTFQLYELLFNNTLEIALAHSADDDEPVVLAPSAIQAVGFKNDEGLLPYPPRSNLAYRLLSEFFAFPEKFLFIDLELPDAATLERFETGLNVYFYLNRMSADLGQFVSADTFRFGCTPMVNLFRQRAEPITSDGSTIEHRIEADARRPKAIEIYSVDHVVRTRGEQEDELSPLYSIRHGETESRNYWHTVRRPTFSDDPAESGTDLFLSIVDSVAEPSASSDYIDLETTCFNRNLPSQLPYGGGQPALQLSAGGAVGAIECLTPPTPTRRPPQRNGAVWRLISHLTLGHLPLEGGKEGAAALREILSLYNPNQQTETVSVSESLTRVESRRAVSRVSGGVCRGTEVRVEFDSKLYSEKGVFLFARVLDHYLGQHCSLNSFTKLTVLIKGWDTPLASWPARAGNKVLT